jgi:hypothetical protein
MENKFIFELEMIKLLNLPEGVRWFTLNCAYDKLPTVECEYEIQDKGSPKVGRDGMIETIRKKYKINLEEIKEEI